MKNVLRAILILLPTLVFQNNGLSQDYIVIVNNKNPVETLTREQVGKLFLKKMDWGNGARVEPVDLQVKSPVRANFTQRVHGKSISAIRSYWQQAVFMGTASVPPEKRYDSEVIAHVRNNPGAIGYVSASANVKGVKILTVD